MSSFNYFFKVIIIPYVSTYQPPPIPICPIRSFPQWNSKFQMNLTAATNSSVLIAVIHFSKERKKRKKKKSVEVSSFTAFVVWVEMWRCRQSNTSITTAWDIREVVIDNSWASAPLPPKKKSLPIFLVGNWLIIILRNTITLVGFMWQIYRHIYVLSKPQIQLNETRKSTNSLCIMLYITWTLHTYYIFFFF